MNISSVCIVCGKNNNDTYSLGNRAYAKNPHFNKGICTAHCFDIYNRALNPSINNSNISGEELNDELNNIQESLVKKPTNTTYNNGVKFDSDKVRWDLLPVEALEELAKVYTFGASKYSDRNWEKGLDYNRIYRAAIHHITDFWMGKNKDDESGLHSLAHCAFNVLALLHFELAGREELDNRPKRKD